MMESVTVYRGRDDGDTDMRQSSTLPVYTNNQDMVAAAIGEAGISYTTSCTGSSSGFTDSPVTYDSMIISKLQSDIQLLQNKFETVRNRPVTVVPIDILNQLYQTNKMLSNRLNMLESRVTMLEQRQVIYQPAPAISNKTTHPYNKS